MAENTEFKVVVGADISEIKSKMAELSGIMSNLSNNMNTSSRNIQSSVGGMASNLKSVLSTLAPIIGGLSFVGFVKSSLMASAELEQIKTSFEVFTGSVEVANKTLTALKEQALKSPMQFQDIANASKTLMSYGITADQVIPISRMLGDISGGNADRFSRLALAFGQVNGAGRLMGQELRQMINAGFNPLQAISENTGQTMAVLTKRMHDGQISVQEVAQAMIYATSEGGRFFQNAEKQSRTLMGSYMKLKESLTFALAEIGASISKTFDLSGAVSHVSILMDTLKNSIVGVNSEGVKSAFWSNALKNTLTDVALIVDVLIRGIKSLGDIFEWLNSKTSFLDSFSDGLDNLVIKMTKNIPLVGKAVKSSIDYVNNFGKSTSIEVKKNTNDVDDYAKALENLLKTLNKTPSGADKTKKTKAQKVEVIPGTDFITKEEGNKIKQLIELNKQAGIDIDSVYETSYERRLEKLNQSFEKQKALYIKYGLDFKNIQSKYLVEYAELKDAIEQKKVAIITGAMDKSIAQFKDLNNPKNFKSLLDSTNIQFGFDEAQISAQADNMKRFGAELYQAQIQVATQLGVGFSEIVGSVLSGDMGVSDAFASLGATFMGAIGGFLVTVGQSAIQAGIIKLGIESALAGLSGGALLAVGLGAVAIGTAMQNVSKKTQDAIANSTKGMTPKQIGGSSSSGITSGNTYRTGGATYGNQAIRLSIDLTGAITASPTGYNINKSLETVLRVTGRE